MRETVLILGSFFATVLASFFTSAETALISSDRLQLSKQKKVGSRQAAAALKHLENIDRLLTTTQFGSNSSIALATTLGTLYARYTMPNYHLYFFLLFTPFVLIFADTLPKVLGRQFANRWALKTSYLLSIFAAACSPVISLISAYTNQLSKFVGLGKLDSLSRRRKARDELQALLTDSDEESEIRLGHKRMIRKILEFSQQNVRKVMLPLVNVDAIEKTTTIQEAIEMFETLRHSRLPVFEDRIDNIVGILYFRDVFTAKDPEKEFVFQHMRPPIFVPEVQLLKNLTEEMSAQDAEMAIAVDEYGGAVGIVTKEDVLEEIVGDISDEWDAPSLDIREISDNTWLVHVTMPIHELNERLGTKLPKGEYETLSGFLLQQFNRIPEVGDELFYGNLRIKVHRASPKSIETVILELQPQPEQETI